MELEVRKAYKVIIVNIGVSLRTRVVAAKSGVDILRRGDFGT